MVSASARTSLTTAASDREQKAKKWPLMVKNSENAGVEILHNRRYKEEAW